MLKEVNVEAVYLPETRGEPGRWYAKCKELKGFHVEAKTLPALKRVIQKMVPIFISESKIVVGNSPIIIHFRTCETLRVKKVA